MSKKNECKRCGKEISGRINIITSRNKIGNNFINVVDMYCNACYKIVNKERAFNNEPNKQKRPCKRKRKNKTRV